LQEITRARLRHTIVMPTPKTYQKLPADEGLDEPFLPAFNPDESGGKITPTASSKLFSVSLSSILIIVLVTLNTGLAIANILATREVVAQTLTILPTQNVMHLNKPDQYYGLSESSRAKRKSLAWCSIVKQMVNKFQSFTRTGRKIAPRRRTWVLSDVSDMVQLKCTRVCA